MVAEVDEIGDAGDGTAARLWQCIFRAIFGDGGTVGMSAHKTAIPSGTSIFKANINPRLAATARQLFPGDCILVIARPSQLLSTLEPRRGDIFIRTARGEGWSAIGVVASDGTHAQDRLASLGFRFEGYPRAEPGRYIHLIEPGSPNRRRGTRFARRLCDEAGQVLPDTMLLRPNFAI
ncbi:hypothetical protein [Paraburkholderia hospita]|nr:hypothetical protein [Paraburkholderia hospita]